ncbi:metalloreductase STEAP3-like [Gouania willdenowi]|uniref:STEAP3 metalloreductase n=1 Tax=Gouania willdenowi TaxID=441366 RepID=A0A8C5DK15_GOUWI|nr:metalloreductase STEAP3 [Gouania willdenowi]
MPDEMAQPLIRGRGPGGGLHHHHHHLEASASDHSDPIIGILGTGDFSRSLAMRLVASGYQVVVGSRNPQRFAALFPEEAEVTSQIEAANQADLVFMALFPEHYSTLAELKVALSGKPLVDVSNASHISRGGRSNAQQLADFFPECAVVKGFNTVSAWTLQTGARDGNRQVFLCSDHLHAKSWVMQISHRMGFTPLDMGLLSSSQELENLPLLLFPSWRIPVVLLLGLFIFFYLYNFTRDILHPLITENKSNFYRMPVDTVNVTLPCVALVLLALVYLPGVGAAFIQLRRGTKYQRFPGWLDRWLLQRKQLGLCSFLCAALHAIYSLSLPMRKSARFKVINEAYKQVQAGVEPLWDDEAVWRMELYVSVGIMALGLLSLLAVTSLPSVSASVNWREFSFIQSSVGHCALTAATVHTLLYGWNRAFDSRQYRFFLPPTFVLVLIPPLVVLLGRAVLLLPCVALQLRRIRRGWEKGRQIRFVMPQETNNKMEDVSNV